MRSSSAICLLLFAGCEAGGLDSEAGSTLSVVPFSGPGVSSSPIVASADGTALYAVLADEGLVTRLNTTNGDVNTLFLGETPSRLTQFGSQLLVTLREARAIAVLEDRDGTLVEVDRISTGAEPLGIVARPDGQGVFVALHAQDEVVELDGDLELVRSFAVPGRPSWLAIHPSGRSLYTIAAVGGALTRFDLAEVAPEGVSAEFPLVLGAGPEDDLYFTRRLTGDPSVRPDGAALALPGLWVDNTSPPNHTEEEQMERDPAVGFAALGLGLAPTNPAIVLVDLDPVDGAFVADGVRMRYATSEATPMNPDTRQVVRSFVSGVAWSPDGTLVGGTMEGSRTVVVLSAHPALESDGLGGFMDGPLATIVTEDGPRGMVWRDTGAIVLNAFALSLVSLPVDEARAGLDAQVVAGDLYDSTLVAEPGTVLSAPTLDAELQEGRLLFSTAIFPQMATPAAGVSCSTCHFEGRNDGLSWPDFDTVPRQTKSLAGPMSLTAPFTWTADVPTVAEEARITSQVRLGGRNATTAELDAVAAWIERTPEVDHPHRGVVSEAVVRGKAIFERSDVGCVRCHSGDRYSDKLPHDMYELEGVDTPALIGIAATAPYLHDGRAATLREVLESSRDGEMGYTGGLSDAEMDDLEAFLLSL